MKFLLAAAMFVLTGCASTRIVSQDPNAEIFLEGRSIGVGEASVGRVGPPKQVLLEARRDGKTVGQREMRRSFHFMTVVWGVCSYYTGFYWGWYYPTSVTIPLIATPGAASESKSPWSDPGGSVWARPLK